MSTLYVMEQGALVQRRGERIIVTKPARGAREAASQEKLAELPLIKLEQVVIMGNVTLTTPAMAILMERGIDVVFLNAHGKYRGRLVGTGSGFGALRMHQYAATANARFALQTAKQIVRGKLLNQRTLLARFYAQDRHPELGTVVTRIDELGQQIARKQALNTLRGIEGRGAALFFQGLRVVIAAEWGFERRARRPPPDPVNALLSLGYTLVGNAMYAAVALTGLDPYLGFLHIERYNRAGLMLDLLEEFRPAIVDGVVVQVLHAGVLQRADFIYDSSAEARLPVRLTDEACKRYIAAIERRLNAPARYPLTREQTTWRRCLELQARQMAQCVQTLTEYQPLLLAQTDPSTGKEAEGAQPCS